MNRREQDAHEDLCRRLVTALNERDAARAEVRAVLGDLRSLLDAGWESSVASKDAHRLAGAVRQIEQDHA